MENNEIKELQRDFHNCADPAIKAIGNEIFGGDSKQLKYFLLSAYETDNKEILTGAGGNLDPGDAFAFLVNLVAQIAKNKGLSEETFCYVMEKTYKNLNGGSDA